jgi:LysM repeat protein
MVDQRDDNREDFIIHEDYAEEAQDLHQEEYYKNASEVFRKKSIMPFVIGGLGLVVVVIMLVLILSRPKNIVDQEYLQSLETRMQQLEKKQAAIGVMDQILERIPKQEQKLDLLDKKLNRFESTVTTQIDQIIKELGALHQKTAQKPASRAPTPKTVEKKQPVASKKTESTTKFHQVQAGDTLFRISRRYGLSIEQLRSYNNLAPNTAIYPGQKLILSPHEKQ